MTPIELSNKVYTNEDAARKHLEAIRWPSGKPTCPICGVEGEARPLNPVANDRKPSTINSQPSTSSSPYWSTRTR